MKANPELHEKQVRIANLKRNYGIAPDDYDDLLASQDGVCAICKKTCLTGNRLCVDHDHKTGAVRGLLCRSCNIGLSQFEDDPVRLVVAVRYLLDTLTQQGQA